MTRKAERIYEDVKVIKTALDRLSLPTLAQLNRIDKYQADGFRRRGRYRRPTPQDALARARDMNRPCMCTCGYRPSSTNCSSSSIVPSVGPAALLHPPRHLDLSRPLADLASRSRSRSSMERISANR